VGTPGDKAFFQANLCRFDHDRFHAMGEDILSRIGSPGGRSQFFKQ
jgi:hypothetical protein